MKTLLKRNLFFCCLAVVLYFGITAPSYGQTGVAVDPAETTDDGDDPDPYEGMELIPAGEFRMGCNSGDSDEKPVHSVYVDAFYFVICLEAGSSCLAFWKKLMLC